MAMNSTELLKRLTRTSRQQYWNPYTQFDWPEALQTDCWYMPPEEISIYGTETWDKLTEKERRRLSLYEIANFFSLVLQGERPLVQGLVDRFHSKGNSVEVTEYLHHFVDEENKHMIMFGEFLKRYIGKVYPEKKIVLPRKYAPGEEEVAFFCKVMVVEEVGDYYNQVISRDERCEPLVREINRMHRIDEARHLAFGRQHLAQVFERHRADWSAETMEGFQNWLTEYVKASWSDYYNPSMYKDAGLADSYNIRMMGLGHPACAAHRKKASSKLISYFVNTGLLSKEIEL